MSRLKLEISAGGLVRRGNPPNILMVQVQNLKGEIVWTFPKGHLEKGETAEQAALREVLEETGWTCRLSHKKRKPFKRVRYIFFRGRTKINKHVVWFLMTPVKKTGKSDPQEIRKVKWFSMSAARKTVRYPSDIKLLEKLS